MYASYLYICGQFQVSAENRHIQKEACCSSSISEDPNIYRQPSVDLSLCNIVVSTEITVSAVPISFLVEVESGNIAQCHSAAAMAESRAESNACGEEEYVSYKIFREYGEEWVMMVLNTPIRNIPSAPPLPEEVKVYHLKYLLVYVPEILPSSLHLEYHGPNQLEDGDVLVIHSLWMWKTYAIVSSAKERKVICFATHNRHPVSDMGALFSKTDVHLREVVLDEVLDTDLGVVEVIVQENPAKTLRNARTALTHGRPWRLFGFNSEHFVTHAATGKAQSPQLNNLLSVGKKAVLSGIMAGLVIPESCTILRKCAKSVAETTTNKVISSSPQAVASQIAKETTKKAANKVASSSTQAAASQVAKEAAKKTASKVASSSTQAAASQVAKEAAKKTASKVASSSTQAAASQVAKEAAKKTASKVASSSTQAAASQVAKEAAKKTASKVASSSTQAAASQVAKEAAKKTASKVASSSTQAAASQVAKEAAKKTASKVASSSTQAAASQVAKEAAKKTASKVASSSTQAAASQVAKEAAKKTASKVASSSTQAAASQVAKEAAKKTASKVASSSTQAAASHVAKHAAKKTANKVASGSTKAAASQVAKQTAKEATEEVAGATAATATSRLANGAKAGLIVGGIVEGACLAYTGYSSYKKMEKGEISKKEFRQHMVKRSAAAGGSVAGGVIGAAIGTTIFPGVGTFIGSVVGGVAGDLLGSKCGEELDKHAFDQNEDSAEEMAVQTINRLPGC